MQWINVLYLATGGILTVAFIPQIMKLWRDTTGAASVSIASWAMFSTCSAITVLYATQTNHDPYFIATACLGMLGNLTVLSLASWRRLGARA